MLLLLIIAVISLLAYALSNGGKFAEISRLVFACATLAICFELARGVGVIEHLQRIGR